MKHVAAIGRVTDDAIRITAGATPVLVRFYDRNLQYTGSETVPPSESWSLTPGDGYYTVNIVKTRGFSLS